MFNLISSQANKLIKLTSKVQNNRTIKSKTKIITITSGKGGVGKSTFIVNMAYLLAQKNYKVAVLDADIGLANLQVLFNIKPKYTFFEYINGKQKLDEVILETRYKNIFLIAGKSDYKYATNTNSFLFSRLVEDIISLNTFDFLLVDTGAGLNNYVKEFLLISDDILALTTPDPSALTDIYSLINMLSNYKNKLFLCFNHTKNYQIGKTITKSLVDLARKNRLNQDFMVEYIGNISTSVNVPTTARLRKLFVHEFDEDKTTKELQMILECLIKNI